MIKINSIFEELELPINISRESYEMQHMAYRLYSLRTTPEAPTRNIDFPVRDSVHWNGVKEDIEDLYYFLTQCSININFVEQPAHYQDQFLPSLTSYSSASLYSGGLDSGAFAVQSMRSGQRNVLCHSATSRMLYGKALYFFKNHVKQGLINDPLAVIKSNAKPSKSGINSTRGLIFITNALGIAKALGIKTVIVPENGPMMINVKVCLKSSPTKTANPHLISELRHIFNKATNSDISVEAPYYEKTKADVVRVLSDNQAIADAYSCSRTQGQKRMCGMCLACFVRMLSCYAADFGENLNAVYAHNPLEHDLTKLSDIYLGDAEILLSALKCWLNMIYPEKAGSRIDINDIERRVKKSPVLHRHALDMYLGIKEYYEKSKKCKGQLGIKALKMMQQIDPDLLEERKQQLLKIS